MKAIYLDDNPLDLTKLSYPILIHGQEGSGASLYTVTLAANIASSGKHILFLCGFPMTEEEFDKQTDEETKVKVKFFVKEHISIFKSSLDDLNDNTIVFIKNVELFENDILEIASSRAGLIISGNITKSKYSKKILSMKFPTKILFSNMDRIKIPLLKRYEGLFATKEFRGTTYLL